MPNNTPDSETAHVGVSTFKIFSTFYSSVKVRRMQFRSALR